MGSLMAGWSSPVLDPETVRHRRNRSLTKEEIERFRRSHSHRRDKGDRELLLYESRSAPSSPRRHHQEMDALGSKRSPLWLPAADADQPSAEPERPAKTGAWWTMSRWAFLNEPPLEEANDSARKYTTQFHVAELATKKH